MSETEIHEYNEKWETPVTRDEEVTDELDTVFDVLRSARRRYILYYLYDTQDAVLSLEELVEAVRQYEAADTETDELPPRQSVRTSLVHAHLPLLAAKGVLDHDSRRGTVRFYGYAPLGEWLERARHPELD